MTSRKRETLALFTTIYPSVEPYLPAWYASVQRQTDRDHDLWICLDGLKPDAVERMLGQSLQATWVIGGVGESPAQIRQRGLSRLAPDYDAVVVVDSDDVLLPSRVEAARHMLETSDLSASALELVDEQGSCFGVVFGLPSGRTCESLLPRHNIFGLSNSAFRTALLDRCLPIPDAAVLIDWFLATRAWLFGARLSFDQAVRMQYRQHGANMARVIGPFTPAQVAVDARRVQAHFEFVLSAPPDGYIATRLAHLQDVADDIGLFNATVVAQPDMLEKYVVELNKLQIAPMWWSSVAHPALRPLWTAGRN